MTFVDTNLLVYAAVDRAPLLDRARAALARAAADGAVTISRQVLRKYLSVITRPQIWGKPLTLAQAVADTAGGRSKPVRAGDSAALVPSQAISPAYTDAV